MSAPAGPRTRPGNPTGAGGSGRLLRLGTRRSQLALTQSRWVAARIDSEVDLVEVTTHGDVSTAPLSSLGGTGVFASALREALLEGRIDLAVHSLKDLPTAPAAGLVIAAVPAREDPRDVLVARDGLALAELPAGARVGTGSPRRAAQLRALGYGLEVVDIRGNVDTRLRLVADGVVDGVVLARAGLRRLGRQDVITEVIDPIVMLPAPGQGALAVECRADDIELVAALAGLQDWSTRACVEAERAVLATLEAGCAAPVGALADVVEGDGGLELSLRAVVAAPDGGVTLRRGATVPLPGSFVPLTSSLHPQHPVPGGVPPGPAGYLPTAEALGQALARHLMEDGAGELMPLPVPIPPGGPPDRGPLHALPHETDSQAGEGDL